MGALAIDINDAGIAVADAAGVLAVEPGFALVDRGNILTGVEAASQSRLKPRQASNRYWSGLSLEPGSAGADVGKSAAELAFAQLGALWKRFGDSASDVLLVVPGGYRTEQLGLLLGLAQECGMPVRALVDVAAAASVRPYPGHQLMYVDAGLYRVAATVLDQGAEAGVRNEQVLAASGLATLADAFARRFAEAFVLATRFDPFHHAETEQQLYDRLPEWLGAFHEQERTELLLTYRDDEFKVTVERDAALAVAAGFYRAVVQLISQNREPGRSLVVQISDRLAALPGFAAELARLDDAYIERLVVGHAAHSVLLEPELVAADGGQVRLLKRLVWRAPPATIAVGSRTLQPQPDAVQDEAPTHLVYRGLVYRVGPQGLVIGREAADGRRVIVVDDQNGGVSRAHCELVLRDGELRLQDLSRYGTFVNEKRISGETTLRRADVIRIGSPGAELQVVSMDSH
jgi:hypothetical protein